ncbi:MAG: M24 family metallopeptidase, partial [Candidatus Aenigmarchaeota archaeon]|nr:M24 family metallopeptidase [Candidatus Aenigmarchaeota archaeon]
MLSDLPALMDQNGYAAVVVIGTPTRSLSQYYVTGGAEMGRIAAIFRNDGQNFLVYSNLERAKAERVPGFNLLNWNNSYYPNQQLLKEDFVRGIAQIWHDRIIGEAQVAAGRPIAFYAEEEVRFWYPVLQYMADKLGMKFDWNPDADLLLAARETKDNKELARIRGLGEATSAAYGNAVKWLQGCQDREGFLADGEGFVTTGRLRNALQATLDGNGYFLEECDIGIGKGSADPHPIRDDGQRIPIGMPVLIDMMAAEGFVGYHSDFTRTLVIGQASYDVRKAYHDALEVREQMLAEIRLGAIAGEVQGTAYQLFESLGYPTNRLGSSLKGFNHTIGHGVGLASVKR